jgi:hypothetical protein
MGILGSSIEIGFSRCLLPVVSLEAWNAIERWLEPSVIGFGLGLDEQRAPSNSWEPFFRRLGAVKGRSSPEATRAARP